MGTTATVSAKTHEDGMSAEERNALVLAYLWCIDSVIRQNYSLVQAAHLDREDVYQSLALRLIYAVGRYRPGAQSLKGYIFSQLKYELLNCRSAQRRYGFCNAPYDLRGGSSIARSIGRGRPALGADCRCGSLKEGDDEGRSVYPQLEGP